MFEKLIMPNTSLRKPCLFRTMLGSLHGQKHFLCNIRTRSIVVITGLPPQSPLSLHDNLQRESHISYLPLTSVTWLQLLRKQTNTGTCVALIAETPWSTRTRLCALFGVVI